MLSSIYLFYYKKIVRL